MYILLGEARLRVLVVYLELTNTNDGEDVAFLIMTIGVYYSRGRPLVTLVIVRRTGSILCQVS